MANIYKSNYTGSQVDAAIGKVVDGKLQEKLTAGSNITISGNTISASVPTIPSITIKNGDATTPATDTVAVISGETASGHTITNTKVNVATKAYVDKKSVAAVQYLGTVSNANELAAKNPDSVGDFCRVAAAFGSYHAGDLLLCKTLKTSSAAATWDVIHGEIDKDTWTANSKTAAGYVAAGGSNANKVWKTDASGNPAWRDDANTDTNTAHTHTVGTGLSIDGSGDISGNVKYSLKVASSSEIGGVKPGTTSGKTYGVAVASDGAMTVAVPWENNTDSKVTSAANHYSPSADSAAQLSASASGGAAATWNSTQLVTGVNLQRDSKGHVTGVTVNSIKMPANPNSDSNQKVTAKNTSGTTVTFGVNDTVEIAGGTNVTVTPDVANKKITIAARDTTYSAGTHISISNGTINAAWPTASDSGYAGINKTGTITGIKMNGVSKGTSGVVDLGTVLTDQDVNLYAAMDPTSDTIMGGTNPYLILKKGTSRSTVPLEGGGGTSVNAGPDGKIMIHSTNVVANPTEASTTTLTKLNVAGTIYSISDISTCAKLSGGNTFSGIQKFNDKVNIISNDGLYVSGPAQVTKLTITVGQILYPVSESVTYEHKLPSKSGTFALTSDLPVANDGTGTIALTSLKIGNTTYSIPSGGGGGDVTAAGNNTFTGMNIFSNTVSGKQGFISANGDNILDNAKLNYNSITRYTNNKNYTLTLPVKTGTLATTDDIVEFPGTSKYLGTAYCKLTREATMWLNGQYGSYTCPGYLVAGYGSGNTMSNADIVAIGPGGLYKYPSASGKIKFTLPSTAGTLALTSDIKIKSASLSGTTLTLTI